jgi:ATP:ADP antiporter, AAA family
MAQSDASQDRRSGLERALGIVTEVRAGEGPSAILLALNVFLLLTAYYIMKPVREGLILELKSGAEYKSYMSAAIAVALLVAVPIYARVADRLPRNRLIVGVTLFFASNLVLFWLGSAIPSLRQYLGLVFYLWIGIFNMMVVAQFWAFANDLYDEAEGKRLFPLVGIGQATGALAGGGVTFALEKTLGVFQMLLVAAAFLCVCALLTQAVHVRESKRRPEQTDTISRAGSDQEQSRRGAFQLVARHRYLLWIALFSLLFSFVNTNGEYILGKLFKQAADDAVAAGEIAAGDAKEMISAGFNQFFFFVNLAGVVLQTFVVSRLVRWIGMRAFFILPLIALGDATAIALVPMLFIARIGKTAENSTDYSLNNTLRNMLWLPTTREMKYKAKQAVDTFFVRIGDVFSGLLVFVAADQLGRGVRTFAITNIVLCALWLLLAVAIVREFDRRTKQRAAQSDSVAPDSAEAS